jgi:hypothetical protein
LPNYPAPVSRPCSACFIRLRSGIANTLDRQSARQRPHR